MRGLCWKILLMLGEGAAQQVLCALTAEKSTQLEGEERRD